MTRSWRLRMADPRGFLRYERAGPRRRPVESRVRDWQEVYLPFGREELTEQAARCMSCGIPFCHEGCPLGNLIPEWNDLVQSGRFAEASDRLHATNNFPELTGRLCPAPCEGSCVLGLISEPVLIKQVELEVAEWAGSSGVLAPGRVRKPTGKKVAVVGSGPAGLAAAQQLTRAGHEVVVFERAERIGGLLRYGIPEFKLEKSVLDRRLAQMEAEGTKFRPRVAIGGLDTSSSPEIPGPDAPDATVISAARLQEDFDAVVLATGATRPRDLSVPGRDLRGVHFAMDYLKSANLVCEGALEVSPIDAAGKRVIIIGGGDTGADCLGTVHRQGAASVTQLEIMPRPPEHRPETQPWPTYPMTYRVSSAHEEGGERVYAVSTQEFVADPGGHVRALRLVEVESSGGRFLPIPGTERELSCDLALLAMGFTGAEPDGLLAQLGVGFDARGNVARDRSFATSVPGVFVAGDMGRGQSLIVWAIAEGRSAAAAADDYLAGESVLPAPIPPTARPMS